MTAQQAQAAARQQLSTSEPPSRDAELLLMHVLRLSRAQLLAHPEQALTSQQQEDYFSLVARRATNEPVQYILGQQEFFGLDFEVTPATLIPRPETELLVEAVLHRLPTNTPQTIADVGTGTGCIPIVLAKHLPKASFIALDISVDALEVARRNAERHGVLDRIQFLQSDLLSAVTGQRFDAVLSNPPYIPESDRDTLTPQVRDFEPAAALFAGKDGLDLYKRLVPQASAALNSGGLLALEIGSGQAEALATLLHEWNGIEVLKDLQGIERTVLARRPGRIPPPPVR